MLTIASELEFLAALRKPPLRNLLIGSTLAALVACAPPPPTHSAPDGVAEPSPTAPPVAAAPSLPAPETEKASPSRILPCTGTLAEYCETYGGTCPTWEQALELRAAMCARPGMWSVTRTECEGSTSAVRWEERVLGGGEEHFDADGQLIGARGFSDGQSYCSGTSLTQTWGELATCPGDRAESICR